MPAVQVVLGDGVVCGASSKLLSSTSRLLRAKKTIREWAPKPNEQSYQVVAWLMQPSGNFDVTFLTVTGAGLDKDVKDVIILPDYARDSIIINDRRNSDLLDFCTACAQLDRAVVVICSRVAQIYYLRGFLTKRSTLNIASVQGEDALERRKQVKAQFAQGEIDILLTSSIFDEGEDLVNVGAVALAGGGSSMVKQIQRIGRGVRKKHGLSNWCPVWFPVDTSNKFVKEQTLARLEYLDRAEVSSVITDPAENWLSLLQQLEREHAS